MTRERRVGSAVFWCPTMAIPIGSVSCGPTPEEVAAGTLFALPFAYLLAIFALGLLTLLWRRVLPEREAFEWGWHLWVLVPLSACVLAHERAGEWLVDVAVPVALAFTGLTCLAARLCRGQDRRLWQRWLPAAFVALLAASQLLVLGDDPRFDVLALDPDTVLLVGWVLAPVVLGVLMLGGLLVAALRSWAAARDGDAPGQADEAAGRNSA